VNPLAHHNLLPPDEPTTSVAPRVRLAWLLAGFSLFWLVIIGRCIQLELVDGKAFRSEAVKPLRREIALPARRGRILARDGSLMAGDEQLFALAMHYRHLQREPEAAWLRAQARRRLGRAERRDRERVDAECARLRREIESLNARLASLCGQSMAEWRANTRRIEAKIETMAARVNGRRWEKFVDRIEAEVAVIPPNPSAWWNIVNNLPDALRALGTPEPAMWEPVVLKEQVGYHILVENVSAAVANAIRQSPDKFPGVRILDVPRRAYPAGTLAANVLGHIRNLERSRELEGAQPVAGAMGLEKSLDVELAGTNGRATERTDRRGQLLATDVQVKPIDGTDVRTTLDAEYQATAEALLDHVLERSRHARGGAVVLLDIHTGELLTLASAPRFDPNAFALGDDRTIVATLTDPRQPLFDRAARMALPPGGLMQPFAAVAMIESNHVPTQVAFQCSGQLNERGDIECAIFQQQGEGHGGVTMSEAIQCDCRVYFAHFAGAVGARRLLQTIRHFGFGTPVGIDILPEASGSLPENVGAEAEQATNGMTQLLAIGQGNVAVTPLQMACAMGALADQGRLQMPRLSATTPMRVLRTGISQDALAQVRKSLERSVRDAGSAVHAELASNAVSIAGIAATANVAESKPPHAWCAGFFPAESPRYAFAVAIEHGGDGLRTAAPVARRLIERVAEREEFAASH
jgi:penicillin-binding protein 2